MSKKRESKQIEQVASDARKTEAQSAAQAATGVAYVDDYLCGGAWKLHTPLGIWIGQVTAISSDGIRLDTCSWVRDEGRMATAVERGELVEHDYVGDGIWILRSAIVIAVPWPHSLPRKSS